MDSVEIDYSKENIQPLREGRLTSYLGTALNAQCSTKSSNEILKEREKFELELRTYKGDDPLDIWYNYICWVIQSYPNGGVGYLTPLLHKCLGTFKDNEKYLQDTRYVKLWVKYIQMQNDPLETYEIAHKHGIGTKCAEFYKSWAEEYEKVGDFKGASSVFKKAFSFDAQPTAELAVYQRNFEDRVARSLAQKTEADWDIQREADERRNVLSSLAMKKEERGKHATVGSVRIGSAVAGPAGSLQQSKKPLQQKNPMPFQIYSDSSREEPYSRVKMETLPSAKVTNRENMLKPGKWTTPASKKSSNTVVHAPMKTPFKVHEDISNDPGVTTPRGASFTENVLKPRKAIKDEFDCPVAIFEPPDPTKKPMYCKDKVYSGGVEFSLEEIRAIPYFEAERQRQKAALEVQENIPISDYKVADDENEQTLKMEYDDSLVATTSNECVPQTPEYKNPKINQLESDEAVCRRSGLNSGTMGSGSSAVALNFDLTNIPSPTINTRAANAMMQELWSTTFTQSLADSVFAMPLQEHSIPKFEVPFDDDTKAFQDIPSSGEEAKRIEVHQPLKFEIFSDDKAGFKRETDKVAAFQDISSSGEEAKRIEVRQPLKFEIFSDENAGFKCKTDEVAESREEFSSKPVDENWGLHIPFVAPKDDHEVEEDESKENHCPPDYETPKERRPLAGLLVPSKNVPFKPLDEEEEEMSHTPQESNSDNSNDRFSACRQFSSNVANTSFEREVLQSLNSDRFELPGKRKITLSEKRESGMINESGFFFSKTVTSKTIETEMAQPSHSGNRFFNDLENSGFRIFSDIADHSASVQKRKIPSLMDTERYHGCDKNEGIEIVENPCSTSMQETLLARLNDPACRSNYFHRILRQIPSFKPNDELSLRQGFKLKILKIISNSGGAKFYLAVKENGELVVIKRQDVSCEWEFYIISEIRNRLSDKKMISAFVNITDAYLFNSDASMLLMEYLPNGTLLDLLNVYKMKQQNFPEVLVLYFTIDILNTVRHLHNIDIIHGAIKPENLLLRNFPNLSRGWTANYFALELPTLQLTNLANSIDLTFFTKNAHFICSKSNDRYQCIEMQNGLPWSFHADLYGIAFTIHCMIFGEFMDLNCRNGTWGIIRKIPRHFNSEIWNSVFHSLINVSSEKFPDLYQMQSFMQEALLTVKFEDFKSAVSNMKLLIEEDKMKKPWLMGIS